MMNVPQELRNQIAENCQHPVLRKILSMKDEEESDKALMKLAAKQVDNEEDLILPWISLGVIYLENPAIQALVTKKTDLRMMLPEILTPGEAAWLAQKDYLLNQAQTRLLIQSLTKPLPKSL